MDYATALFDDSNFFFDESYCSPISLPLEALEPMAFPYAPTPNATTFSWSPIPIVTETDRLNGAQTGRGRWTEYEHSQFLNAIALRPKISSKDVAKMVPTRTPRQVRTHSQKYFEKLDRQQKRKENSKKITADKKRKSTATCDGRSSSVITLTRPSLDPSETFSNLLEGVSEQELIVPLLTSDSPLSPISAFINSCI